jgi:hypothetical protein
LKEKPHCKVKKKKDYAGAGKELPTLIKAKEPLLYWVL